MKKIRITESQLKELKKRLAEQQADLKIAAQPDANGKVSQVGLQNQARNAAATVGGDKNKITMEVPGETLAEGNFVTKKAIREAKARKLKENCNIIKKSDI